MNKENKISVVVNTYNAEQHLDEVLQAVSGFDEIVVCDMESTDTTLEIAEKHGCKVITFPRGTYNIVEPAREFAIHQVSCQWVLVVDADEIVTPELRNYLYQRISEADCPDGLFIPRRNKLIGRYLRTFSADRQLRFFNAAKTHWPPLIHAVPQVEGRVERIPKGSANIQMLHLEDKPQGDIFAKANCYTDNEMARKRNKRYGILALLWRPLWRGFRSYVLQGNFRNGVRGAICAGNTAVYQFMLVSKIIEKRLREEADRHENASRQ